MKTLREGEGKGREGKGEKGEGKGRERKGKGRGREGKGTICKHAVVFNPSYWMIF